MNKDVGKRKMKNNEMHLNEMALDVLLQINSQLSKKGVNYCHWKSNYHLAHAMSGKEDWDVLVNKLHFNSFLETIISVGAKEARSNNDTSQYGVYHYYILDEQSGTLVHLHIYLLVLTGDSLVKSHRLPFEKLLLNNLTQSIVPTPTKEAELIVFMLRNALKLNSPLDIYLHVRAQASIKNELNWLSDDCDMEKVYQLTGEFFPQLDRIHLQNFISSLSSENKIITRIVIASRISACLSQYRRFGWIYSQVLTTKILLKIIYSKFVENKKYMKFQNGGKIIAFTGPQAVGKSTLSKMIREWLGAEFQVSVIHVGKPPATLLTLPVRLILPMMRILFPKQKSTFIEKEIEMSGSSDRRISLIHVVRKLILGYERRKILKTIFRKASNGEIILCDRYPSDIAGAVDGASFSNELIELQSSALKRYLMRQETKLYENIFPPDIVISLSISVEEAIRRDQMRDKIGPKDPDYVRFRHTMSAQPNFNNSHVIKIMTDRPLDTTALEIKKKLWRFV